MDLELTPGTMGLALLMLRLCPKRADVGQWGTPVWVRNIDHEEAVIIKELLDEYISIHCPDKKIKHKLISV